MLSNTSRHVPEVPTDYRSLPLSTLAHRSGSLQSTSSASTSVVPICPFVTTKSLTSIPLLHRPCQRGFQSWCSPFRHRPRPQSGIQHCKLGYHLVIIHWMVLILGYLLVPRHRHHQLPIEVAYRANPRTSQLLLHPSRLQCSGQDRSIRLSNMNSIRQTNPQIASLETETDPNELCHPAVAQNPTASLNLVVRERSLQPP